MNPGICLVHKEIGESSFDVVRRFKQRAREAGVPKLALGHGGTLDPFAEGLLLVLAGQGTRLMELLHPLPKTYVAELVWGTETDTCDHLGLPVGGAGAPVGEAFSASAESALADFLGWRAQVPPATSAKKIGGESAYKKAHRGEEVVLPPSRVYLHAARWLAHGPGGRSRLELTCRGGFYVRSLARDLGRVLGCGAHLSGLSRTAIGPWTDPGSQQEAWVRGADLLPWCAARVLDDIDAEHLRHGRPIAPGQLLDCEWRLPEGFPDPDPPIRALHGDRLVALLRPREGRLWSVANLRGGL